MAARKRKFVIDDNGNSVNSKRQRTMSNNKQTLSSFGFVKGTQNDSKRNRLLSAPSKEHKFKGDNNCNNDFILKFIDDEISKKGDDIIYSEDKFNVDFNEMKQYFNRKNKEKDKLKENNINNIQNINDPKKSENPKNDDEMKEFQLDVIDSNSFFEQFLL